MDLTGFETYIAYSLRGAKAQADASENTTLVAQSQTEEKETEETQQDL